MEIMKFENYSPEVILQENNTKMEDLKKRMKRAKENLQKATEAQQNVQREYKEFLKDIEENREWRDRWSVKARFAQMLFFFIGHKETIYADHRMYYAAVPVHNGIAYGGSLRVPTLGVYLKWLDECTEAFFKVDNEDTSIEKFNNFGVILQYAGSPMSGSNKCLGVTKDGFVRTSVGSFGALWKLYSKVSHDCYFEDEENAVKEAGTLMTFDEVYDELCKNFGSGVKWKKVRAYAMSQIKKKEKRYSEAVSTREKCLVDMEIKRREKVAKVLEEHGDEIWAECEKMCNIAKFNGDLFIDKSAGHIIRSLVEKKVFRYTLHRISEEEMNEFINKHKKK